MRAHFRKLVLLILVACSLWAVPAAPIWAQVRVPAEAVVDTDEVRQVLQQGLTLEQQRRWGEALLHYEDASRSYPDQPEIEQRLTSAKIHYDLGRRYSDPSFLDALRQLSELNTLDVYGEVLLKIQTHYVDSPDWQALMRRGTANLDIAMTEPAFVERHLAKADRVAVDRFRRHLHEQLDSRPVPNRYDAKNVVKWVGDLAAQELGMSAQAAIQEYIAGATSALDDYSGYLTANQLDDVFSQIEGNFVGLGIELKADDDSLLIVDVIPGGPAAEGGIQPNDRIVAVDGRTTKELTTDAAADMLKGEENSLVSVEVLSADGNRRSLRLVRRRVDVPSVVKVDIIDKEMGVGYFHITSFQKSTSRDVDSALWSLQRRGMKSLIIDVRGNPGGLLNSAVEIADKFISNGAIVSTRGRSSRENYDYMAHAPGTWRVPLIVLIDSESASASEIFAGAIRDQRRGTVVGVRSYGKGSVQGIFPLDVARGGVRLTTAKFYSPSGQAISKRGVQPDVSVRVTAKVPAEGDLAVAELNDGDQILKAGLQVVRDRLSQR